MMTFSLGKKQLFTLLFFLYYIVYAISPLTYTFSEQKNLENSREPGQASPAVKGIRLFLWELVMENVVSPEETAPDHTAETVLIKKKRALLPEDAAAKLLPFDTASIPKDHYALPVPISGRTAAGHVAFHGTREGFSTVYAGHSPPLG
jgi:hypothetical protein